MKSIFVDTSAWYPIADSAHPDHVPLAAALRRAVGTGTRIVTTNLVVAETYVLLLRRVSREAALTFLRLVRRPPNLVAYATPEREASAISEWLERYEDQAFSLADAVSFTVMTELEIDEAMTLDRHFATAGFTMVGG